MTRVRIGIEDEHGSLTAEGHAEYAPAGQDICCAGISTMIYALAGYLTNADDVEISAMEMEPGRVLIEADGEIEQAFLMTYIGLQQLAEKFPENLEVFLYS